MRAISLLYHDVVTAGQYDASGFPGGGAARYKLELDEFKRHVKAIAEAVKADPIRIWDLPAATGANPTLMVTFDDGGLSAYQYIADILESYGWHGHVFVTVNYIGRPSFVTKEQIRALRKRGHVIGSHSCSHPERMSYLNWNQLTEEWATSIRVLSDVVEEPVTTASVPGGYYSKRVAEAAAASGIEALFTSEPTTRCHYVNGCVVLGRYTVWRGMAPTMSAGFAAGEVLPRLKQALLWNVKKAAKTLGGRSYSKLRKYMLEGVHPRGLSG
jgi:peptidoglycan/xylan/chitin deacetylase (PgdA/CDA1 family)